jgi:hypothetical protein
VSAVKLNWRTAEVKDGKLTVELEGELPKGWKQSFETTARLLSSGGWGDVQLKKHAVCVGEVAGADEDKLRHYLEGVVDQANANTGASDEESDGKDEESDRDDRDEHDGDDAEMTERFREFGQDEQHESSESDD